MEEEDDNRLMKIADELFNVAWSLMKVANCHDVLLAFRLALSVRGQHYGEEEAECAYAFYSYGFALLFYHRKGRVVEIDYLEMAVRMLQKAKDISEKNPQVTEERADILFALGDAMLAKGDVKSAMENLQASLSILEKILDPTHQRIVRLQYCMNTLAAIVAREEVRRDFDENDIEGVTEWVAGGVQHVHLLSSL